jgi:hypothetical protein
MGSAVWEVGGSPDVPVGSVEDLLGVNTQPHKFAVDLDSVREVWVGSRGGIQRVKIAGSLLTARR